MLQNLMCNAKFFSYNIYYLYCYTYTLTDCNASSIKRLHKQSYIAVILNGIMQKNVMPCGYEMCVNNKHVLREASLLKTLKKQPGSGSNPS